MTVALASLAPPDALAEGRAALYAGDPLAAATLFNAAAQEDPADHESRYWLYSALVACAQPDAARAMLEEARTLHAVAAIRGAGADMSRFETDKAYCAQIGYQLYAAHLMGEASVALGRALDFDNLDPRLMLSYGLSLQHQGRLAEAIDVFSAAAEIFADPAVHEFLLHPVFIIQCGPGRMAEETRKWGDLYAAPLTPLTVTFANARTTDRPLRVGYIGPTFTRNQVAQFILPVLEAHDPKAVELHLYCEDPDAELPLPATSRLRKIGGLGN
ncbi:MAG TPA: tetratricopeptide repeat protein, partial [Phenylobacterium sp.]|nr:tetratricopeptide repeat protein [Phenylobacterium sp.]